MIGGVLGEAVRTLLDGVARDMAGSKGEAATRYRKALDCYHDASLMVDPWAAVALNNLAVLEAGAGHPDLAMRYLERAWQLNDAAGDPLSVLINICNLATVAGSAGSMTEAARYRTKALKARVAVGQRDITPSTGWVPGNMSRLMDLDAWMEAEDDSLGLTPPPLPSLEKPLTELLGPMDRDDDDDAQTAADAFFDED